MKTLPWRVAVARPAPVVDRAPVTLDALASATTPVEWLETLTDLQMRVIAQTKGIYARQITEADRLILTAGPAPYSPPHTGAFANVAVSS